MIGNTEQGQMQPGDCFTIEPCLVQGSDARGDLWDDGWTMSTLVCHATRLFDGIQRSLMDTSPAQDQRNSNIKCSSLKMASRC